MRQQPFGSGQPKVSVIGQGTWYLDRGDRKKAIAALQRGIDLGMTHIDTAEMYGDAELVIADAIAGRRDEAFLVSKVGRFCSMLGTSGPDGLTMDAKGRLFVAHASLGHVFVFAANGELLARIKSCAGSSCTNVAIGGAARDRLYITESASGTVLVANIGILDEQR